MNDFPRLIPSKIRRGILAMVLMGAFSLTSTLASAAVAPAEVERAIDKGMGFLLSKQQKEGSWEVAPRQVNPAGIDFAWGGHTAMATYTLLAAGKSVQDPAISKALEWLVREDLHGTYPVSFRAQVWNLIPERARTKAILAMRDRDRDFLLYSRIQVGPHRGFYSYRYNRMLPAAEGGVAPFDPKGPGGVHDRSCSEYAMYGAEALEQAGAEFPWQYWLDEDAAWKKVQHKDGWWDYSPDQDFLISNTMTCAGVAALFITQDNVLRADPRRFDMASGGIVNAEIRKGLAYLEDHAQRAIRDPLNARHLESRYAPYGIARVALAGGRKYLGGIDWFDVGAESIVRSQAPDGWGSIHNTCYALLFLTYGRAPVMMNKLQYAVPDTMQIDPWNERPGDVAHLARWAGRNAVESRLNWQIVTLQDPADDLHDAPILYISGSEAVDFDDKDIEKLRTFVEEGGMILGNADCLKPAFIHSFFKLGKKLFPRYEFRRLPSDHPIFDEQYRAIHWKIRPQLLALSNGVREMLLISPDTDMGQAWQTDTFKTRETSFQLAANIYHYATGRQCPSHRSESWLVRPVGPAGAGEIKVARLQVGANWNPEPAAWRRLSAILHNQRQIDIAPDPIKLGAGRLAGYKIAALTGTTRIRFDPAQRAELKEFVNKGGTLLVDAAGGATDFADTAETELKEIFGDAASKGLSEPLPPTHALYADLNANIRYRSFTRTHLTGRLQEPRLRAITADGDRITVFYSREDLTAGLVGREVHGISGYEPRSAVELMSRMILWADAHR